MNATLPSLHHYIPSCASSRKLCPLKHVGCCARLQTCSLPPAPPRPLPHINPQRNRWTRSCNSCTQRRRECNGAHPMESCVRSIIGSAFILIALPTTSHTPPLPQLPQYIQFIHQRELTAPTAVIGPMSISPCCTGLVA